MYGDDLSNLSMTELGWMRRPRRFSADTYIYGTEPNDFLRDSVETLPRGTALCLAEGEGRNAVFLAESGFDVHSVDLTDAGVAKTLRLAAR